MLYFDQDYLAENEDWFDTCGAQYPENEVSITASFIRVKSDWPAGR